MPPGLAARARKALGKVRGFLAVRERVVYVDPGLSYERERFTLGHELGHTLPWQRPAYAVDDDSCLSPEVRDRFEREANAFSAELLFNLDSFRDAASDSAVSLAVPLTLAATYGVSVHAAVRRYVEDNPRSCALFVVGRFPVSPAGKPGVKVLHALQSTPFLERYGAIGAQLSSDRVARAEHPWAEAAWQALHGGQLEPVTSGKADVGALGPLHYEVTAARFAFVLLRPRVRRSGRPVRALWVPPPPAS
jgi:hypothetical protein